MLNEVEKRALEMLLAGEDDRLAVLRSQLKGVSVARRELSGAGFFTHLSVPAHLPRVPSKQLVIGDLYSEVAGLQHPAGFLLFVTDGTLDLLECFTVDDQLPETATLYRHYYVHPSTPGTVGGRYSHGEMESFRWLHPERSASIFCG
jgi:hypothetical protein